MVIHTTHDHSISSSMYKNTERKSLELVGRRRQKQARRRGGASAAQPALRYRRWRVEKELVLREHYTTVTTRRSGGAKAQCCYEGTPPAQMSEYITEYCFIPFVHIAQRPRQREFFRHLSPCRTQRGYNMQPRHFYERFLQLTRRLAAMEVVSVSCRQRTALRRAHGAQRASMINIP